MEKHKSIILCNKCGANLKAVYSGGSRHIKLNKYMYCSNCEKIYIIEQKGLEVEE